MTTQAAYERFVSRQLLRAGPYQERRDGWMLTVTDREYYAGIEFAVTPTGDRFPRGIAGHVQPDTGIVLDASGDGDLGASLRIDPDVWDAWTYFTRPNGGFARLIEKAMELDPYTAGA